MSARVLFHIDLNAFYASVAQTQDPSLKGKPVVIARNRSGSVITTASYEARQYGIHSAMPLSVALQKHAEILVVEPDFALYRKVSDQFINYLKTISPLVEVLSIDECFIDVTEQIKQYDKPLDLAYKIQRELIEKYQLPCSIGVAPNRFLAKMASDFKKPLGISVLRMREVKRKLWPLSIQSFYGIGKVTQEKLLAINVKTIGDLLNVDKVELEPILGNQLDSILDKANGIDSSELEIDADVKSISASNSLLKGIDDYQEIHTIIFEQCEDIVEKLLKNNVMGLTLSVTVGFDQQKPSSKSQRNEGGFSTLEQIYQSALLLFDQFDFEGSVTFLGVAINNLKTIEEDEIYNLFNYQQRSNSVNEIIDTLNSLFDSDVFRKASDE